VIRVAPLFLLFSILAGEALASPLDFLVLDLLKADPGPPELSVTIIGYQYGWRYDYPNADGDGTCLVEGALVLPQGKRVQLSFTADDIIHEWRVPALDLAADAIPGLLNVVTFSPAATGIFKGGATSQSGSGYEAMAFNLKIIEPEAYSAWAKNVAQSCKAP
jgi:cytochrome c oxidase subunit 2